MYENLSAVSKYCPIEPMQWGSTKLNYNDLLTRGDVNLRDLGPTSFHKEGPEFLLPGAVQIAKGLKD